MKKHFLFLLITASISNVYSNNIENKTLFSKILKQLNIEEKDVDIELCNEKVLPNSTTNTVFVIAKYRGPEREDEGSEFINLDEYIVLTDNTSNEIICFFFEESAWTSDAVRLSSIEIDTGLYKLNDQTRAFGIRVNYSGSSHPNPYSQTDLSLFIAKGKSLKRILKDFQFRNLMVSGI